MALAIVVLLAILGWMLSRSPALQPVVDLPPAETARGRSTPAMPLEDAEVSAEPQIVRESKVEPNPIESALPAATKLVSKSTNTPRYSIGVLVYDCTLRELELPDIGVTIEDEQGVQHEIALDRRTESWLCTAKTLHAGRFTVTVAALAYAPKRMVAVLSPENHGVFLRAILHSASTLKIKLLTENGSPLAPRVQAEADKWVSPRPASNEGPAIVTGLSPFGVGVVAVAMRENPGDQLPETSLSQYSRFGANIYRGWGSRYTESRERSFSEDRSVDPVEAGLTEEAGVLELFEPLPLYVSACVRSIVLETQLVPEGTKEITFKLGLDRVKSCYGEVRLRVVDAITERPVHECEVILLPAGVSGGGVRPGKDGSIIFQSIEPGTAPLSIIAAGHAGISTEVRVDAGRVNDLGTFRLQPAISIRGSVVDAKGQPIFPMMNVGLVPLDEYRPDRRVGALWSGAFSSTNNGISIFMIGSNESGEFFALNVGRGRYLLRSLSYGPREWTFPPIAIDTTGGSVGSLRIQAQRGTTVTFRFNRDAPEDTWVRVLDADDTPARDIEFWQTSGDVRVPMLPGTYRCVVFSEGQARAPQKLDVGTIPMKFEVPR